MRDVTIELRERHSYLSSLLYLVAITFVVYKVFGRVEAPTRVGLFWILILFTSINVISYSFSFHAQKRKLYHYTLYRPLEMIIAKWGINCIKLIIAGIVLVGLQILFSNEGLKNPILFFQTYVLCVIGLTAALTFISSVSSYSQNQNNLMAILSLPLLIPILLLGMRTCMISERIIIDTAVNSYLLMLGGIDIIFVALLIIFIPLTWKS